MECNEQHSDENHDGRDRITAYSRMWQRPVLLGVCKDKCLQCGNWIISIGEDLNTLTCADHVEWRARLLHEKRMIATALQNKTVCGLPKELRWNVQERFHPQPTRARLANRAKKAARLLRRQQSSIEADTDTILIEVSNPRIPHISLLPQPTTDIGPLQCITGFPKYLHPLMAREDDLYLSSSCK